MGQISRWISTITTISSGQNPGVVHVPLWMKSKKYLFSKPMGLRENGFMVWSGTCTTCC